MIKGDSWVVQTVKHWTLDLHSGRYLIESHVWLSADRWEPAWYSLSSSLCTPPLFLNKQTNKLKIKYVKMIKGSTLLLMVCHRVWRYLWLPERLKVKWPLLRCWWYHQEDMHTLSWRKCIYRKIFKNCLSPILNYLNIYCCQFLILSSKITSPVFLGILE